jgi:hypothetical protein
VLGVWRPDDPAGSWHPLIVAAVRAPLLPIPLERDEGEYAYIASRLKHNELPYRDWVDQKPPAVFYIYRLALSLLVEPVRAIHFAGLVFAAASACALFFLRLRFMDRFWAWLGAALFAQIRWCKERRRIPRSLCYARSSFRKSPLLPQQRKTSATFG